MSLQDPGLLERVVEQISQVPMEDRDTKGDLYEYMLSKLTTAGRNGQFRTPRHIIKMMVDLMHFAQAPEDPLSLCVQEQKSPEKKKPTSTKKKKDP